VLNCASTATDVLIQLTDEAEIKSEKVIGVDFAEEDSNSTEISGMENR